MNKLISLLALLVFVVASPAHAQFVPGQTLTASQLNNALATNNITGGSVNNSPIGASVPSTGAFTTGLFTSQVGIGTAIVGTTWLGLPSSTGLKSSLNVSCNGSAPSSPVNGDVWCTSAGGLYVQVNGVAVGPLGAAPTVSANSVLGNATGSSAPAASLAVGSCSTSSSAVIYTTNTGFGCNTAIAASTATSATTSTNLSGAAFGTPYQSALNTTSMLASTATAGQMFRSGATAAPSWSTTTWPATTTINQLLYSSSASVIAGLATANSAVVSTTSGGVPQVSTQLPSNLGIGVAGAASTALSLPAGSTSVSSFNIVCTGVAPTSPNNGDVWCTSSGLFIRVNGVTVGPLVSGGVAGMPAGLVGSPTMYFGADSTTGWYRSSANNWAYTVSGSQAFVMGASFTFPTTNSGSAGTPTFIWGPGGNNGIHGNNLTNAVYISAGGSDIVSIDGNLNVLSGNMVVGGSGNVTTPNLFVNGGLTSLPKPVTKVSNYTIAYTEYSIIFNSASTITLTLGSAASASGMLLMLKTINTGTVISNASNVVPLAGGAAGTAILGATAGKWCTLHSDGTNWIIMQAN